MPKYKDCTLLQQTFFNLMSSYDINYRETLDVKVTAIAEALGVKFKKKMR